MKLWSHLERGRRYKFIGVFFLMVVAAMSEMISIGSVVPFLLALTDPNRLYELRIVNDIFLLLNYKKADDLILPITIVFISAIIFSAGIRMSLLFFSTRLSFSTGVYIGREIYRRTLYQPYEYHATENSSELINAVISKINILIYNVFLAALNLLSSVVIMLAITITFAIINPIIFIGTTMGIAILYGGIIFITRKKLTKISAVIANDTGNVIKSMQEGLGGIRDIIIDGNQELFSDIFHKFDKDLRKAEGDAQILVGSPRFFIEASFMILIALFAFFVSGIENGLLEAIPLLGAVAIGTQKILPVCHLAYQSLSAIKASRVSLIDILLFFEKPYLQKKLSSRKKMGFEKEIRIENLGFKYRSSKNWVLRNLDITIKKGDCVGFIGKTGSGKTTLLDVIMGLLVPLEGKIFIDSVLLNNKNIGYWQSHIAHVPQEVHLTSGSLLENIAYGVPLKDVNLGKIKKIIRHVKLESLVNGWVDGYHTNIGENGAKLSGGQKQRIGIARALYKNSQLIILDEATSSLDPVTEKDIMHAVTKTNKETTILIITHRYTTLSECDKIYEIKNGTMFGEFEYGDFLNERKRKFSEKKR